MIKPAQQGYIKKMGKGCTQRARGKPNIQRDFP